MIITLNITHKKESNRKAKGKDLIWVRIGYLLFFETGVRSQGGCLYRKCLKSGMDNWKVTTENFILLWVKVSCWEEARFSTDLKNDDDVYLDKLCLLSSITGDHELKWCKFVPLGYFLEFIHQPQSRNREGILSYWSRVVEHLTSTFS